MSDTPLTDAKSFVGQSEWAEDNAPLLDCVEAVFARTLERENQQLKAELKVCAENLHCYCKFGNTCSICNAKRQPLTSQLLKGEG